MKYYTAFSTFPSIELAREVSRELVEKKLVACVNIVPVVESIYEWEGKICEEQEVLVMMKVSEMQLTKLEECLVVLHPYEVPEFITIEIKSGHQPYLDWLGRSSLDLKA